MTSPDLSDQQPAPYGSWPSPITAELIVAASVGLGGPATSAGDLWWSELRPTEGGRVQIVRKALDAAPDGARDVLPDGYSARTRVHEYGGGAWWLHEDTLFFVNWSDQRLYRLDHAGADDASEPVAITAEPDQPGGFRYADGRVTPDGNWAICVREWHGAPGADEARNEIVAVPTDGSTGPTTLVGGMRGPDFVANPRLSADGRRLCWVQWNHPDMPWDATELWLAAFDPGSHVATPTIEEPQMIAGGPSVSVGQPSFVGDDVWFVVDQAAQMGVPAGVTGADGESPTEGYWNLVADAVEAERRVRRPVTLGRFEVGEPAWVFGQSSWAVTGVGAVVVRGRFAGIDHLGVVTGAMVDPDAGGDTEFADIRTLGWAPPLDWLDLPWSSVEGLTAIDGSTVAFIGSDPTSEPAVMTLDLAQLPDTSSAVAGAPTLAGPPAITVHRPARDLGLDPAWYSVPEHIEFPTTAGPDGDAAVAYALFYPPVSPTHRGPDGGRPPLLVMSHGGPTSAARPQLNLAVQFWTSRGIAVVDVNYRGSTGYGRAYRDALRGQWGLADVDDCIAAARHLAAEGRVDGDRLAIRGGSAGGYTTLCALTFHDDFSAGCSLYGVADLAALATDTHKFESRYLDGLIGPYPERRDLYEARSPIHHTDQLATPLIVLQGLEDEIVPPAQAEMMVAALHDKGVPHAYLAFEGEQHGFRQAPNIRRALEAELYFYGRVLGFEVSDDIEPVTIENLS